MDIYSVDDKGLNELKKEFNKTSYGVRASMFALFPLMLIIPFGIAFAGFVFVDEFVLAMITATSLVVSTVGLFITQMLYYKALKEYAETKKKK